MAGISPRQFVPQPDNPTQLKYRPDIDGLRAFAVLAVIGFHAFPDFFKGGFVGVDVFFVISGYLISGVIFNGLEKQRFSFREFYGRRIRRIFPALILVLMVTYIVGWFTFFPDELKLLGKDTAAGAGFTANVTLWQRETNYFNDALANPLLHLWSLGVEEQFYLVWPALLWLLWKLRARILSTFLLIGIASFVFSVFAIGGPSAAFYLPVPRFWELILGSILAYLSLPQPRGLLRNMQSWLASNQDKPWMLTMRNLASALGILLVTISIVVISKSKPFLGLWDLLPTTGVFLVLCAGPKAWLNRVVLANRILVWIGLISYPLYLWHWPLLSFASIVEGQVSPLWSRAIVIVLSIALATLTYICVEKPVRFGGHRTAKVAVLLCLLMIFMGCTGYETYTHDGFDDFRSINLRDYAPFKANLQQLNWFEPDAKCLHLLDLEGEYRHKQAVFCSVQDDLDMVQVAVFGDSSANALYPGLEKVFKEKQIGVINLGNGTCSPFRGLHGNFDFNQNCDEVNDKIYAFLLNQPRIKLVVLSTVAWDVEKMQFGDLQTHDSLEVRFSALSKLVARDIAALQSAGKKVVVTFDSPMFNTGPRACIFSSAYMRSTHCLIAEDQLIGREPYLSLWRSMIARQSGVCIFDQSPRFKIGDRYTLLSPEGIILYRDNHHLSYHGSELMARKFIASPCSL